MCPSSILANYPSKISDARNCDASRGFTNATLPVICISIALILQYKTPRTHGISVPTSVLFNAFLFQKKHFGQAPSVCVFRILCTVESQTTNRLPNLFALSPGLCLPSYLLLLTCPSTMLFTIVLFALATAGPVFSAPVPSTKLKLHQELVDA